MAVAGATIQNLQDLVNKRIVERLRRHGWTFLWDALIVSAAYVCGEATRFGGHIPGHYMHTLPYVLPIVAVIYSVASYSVGLHRQLWWYAGGRNLRTLIDAWGASLLATVAVDLVATPANFIPVSALLTSSLYALIGLAGVRTWSRVWRTKRAIQNCSCRVLIVGAGAGGQMIAADMEAHMDLSHYPVGFLDDDPNKQKMRIQGLPVLGPIASLPEIADQYNIDIVAVAIPSSSTRDLEWILELAQRTNARIQVLPSQAEVIAGGSGLKLRDINLNYLLDRVPTGGQMEEALLAKSICNKVVMVTGGAGSIGSELCRQLVTLGAAKVLALDNNETALFHLEREISAIRGAAPLDPILATIARESKVDNVFRQYQPEVVFHAAAYKHVPMLQAHMDEAVFVNVGGTLNLCRAATRYNCERFVFVSTDKAVNPVNNLGFSKRIGELIVRAHGSEEGTTVFCSVRFGNVIGSRGSALPEFIRQIDAGGPVTVTHPDVERYFMTIPEAVNLVIQAGALATGGELFMLDMGEPIKISHLVERLIRLKGLRIGSDIEIHYTGLRPGEKLTEDLVFDVEHSHATSVPSIYSVDDPIRPDRSALTADVDALLRIAAEGDMEKIGQALCRAARGEPLQASALSI